MERKHATSAGSGETVAEETRAARAAAEHDAWITSEIERTIAKKADGRMGFRTLDEVMRKFGFR